MATVADCNRFVTNYRVTDTDPVTLCKCPLNLSVFIAGAESETQLQMPSFDDSELDLRSRRPARE